MSRPGAARSDANREHRALGGGPEPRALPELLLRAARTGRARGVTVLGERAGDLSYDDLLYKARCVALRLHAQGVRRGDPVVLCARDSASFLPLFWGAIVLGAVPAPVPHPTLSRGLDSEAARRVLGVARALGTWVVCAGQPELQALESALGTRARVLDQEALSRHAELGPILPELASPGEDDLAVLQYSSGSTAAPKGVALTHRNIVTNIRAMARAEELCDSDRLLSWLPYFHDFGLFGNHLTAVFAAIPELRLEPEAVVRGPSRWLEAVHAHRATVSFSTPAGLRLLAQELERRSRRERSPLDLSSLRFLGIGAEMIPHGSVRAFQEAANAFGLRRGAVRFGYGLAESTLIVTMAEPESEGGFVDLDRRGLLNGVVMPAHASADAKDRVRFAKLGRPIDGARLEVRDSQGRVLAPEMIGRVFVGGDAVSHGYFGDAAATARVRQGEWLDTGDLGFFDREGELVLTGRDKELIIQNGRNIHPHDLEQLAENAASGVVRQCIATSDYDASEGVESLLLFFVLEPRSAERRGGGWVERVRAAVQRVFYVDVRACISIRPADVPRTSSGKIQRHELARLFREEGLGISMDSDFAAGASVKPDQRALAEEIATAWRRALGLPTDVALDMHDFFSLGGDSLRAVRVQSELESMVGAKLPANFCHRQRTIAEQARYLASCLTGRTAPADDLEQLVARVVAYEVGASVDVLDTRQRLLDVAPDMAVASRVYSELGRVFEVPGQTLERANSIAEIAGIIREHAARSLSVGGSFDLMQFQETLYFHRQGYVANEPSRLSCYIVYRAKLRGSFDVPRFEAALEGLTRRHAMLRAVIDESGDRPRLRVLDGVIAPRVLLNDLRGGSPVARDRDVLELDREDQDYRCLLDRFPLFRARVVRLEDGLTQLTLHIDHMLIDGYGFLRLVVELFRRYDALGRGEAPPEAPPIPFERYVQIEHFRRRTREYAQRMQQHLEVFQELPPRFTLPMRDNPARIEAVHFRTHHTHMPVALMRTLEAFARECRDVSLNALLLASYFKLMCLWSNQEDLIINVPIFNRDQYFPAVQEVVGSFIDIFPVRLQSLPTTPLLSMAKKIEAFNRALLEYPVSSIDLARRLAEREQNHGSLSSVIFSNSIHLVDERSLLFDELELVGLPEVHTGAPGTYIDLVMFNVGDRYCFDWNYVAELFEPSFITVLSEQYRVILEQLAEAIRTDRCDAPFDPGAVLPPSFRQSLATLNDTAADFDDRPIHLQIADVVRERPDALAVTFGARSLTYQQLQEAAHRVANFLHRRGVGPGDFVAVLLGRGADLIVAQLGVLAAGAAYVPIDPGYPQQRIRYMIADSRARIVITHARHAEAVGLDGAASVEAVLTLDQDGAGTAVPAIPRALEGLPTSAPPVKVGSSARMYMIYTSGSTGLPKGVMVSHRSFSNFIHHVLRTFARGPEEQFALVTSHSFDMTLSSNWGPFLSGATLHVQAEEETRNVERLLRFLEERRISLLNVTPSHFSLLVQALPLVERAPRLPQNLLVLLGGETINIADLNAWLDRFPTHEFVNEYGPTEVTVASTFFPIPKNAEGRIEISPVPIGKPIANTRVYTLTEDRQHCMPGVPGYLYLAGDGVADGYWEKPEKTQAAFVPDPYGPEGSRMYFTGDMARFLPDGDLVFLGRRDHQVNLRGYRIELGEIEAALQGLKEIREAAVELVRDASGEGYLVAFFVPSGAPVGEDLVRGCLAAELPEHMIPVQNVALSALPLTPSGKLDRSCLQRLAAEHPRRRPRRGGRGAESDLERALQRIWADVLGLPDVAVDDDFWQLGVNSLRVMRLVQRVRGDLGLPLGLAEVFEHRSIAALARAIASKGARSGVARPTAYLALARAAAPELRIVALPYAGGTAAVYSGLEKGLGNIEVLSARYPGHEGEGAALSSVEQIGDYLARELPDDAVPTLFLGMSFGGYVAYELARRALRSGRRVQGLILASATPPRSRDRIMELAEMPEPQFRAAVLALQAGGLRMTDAELDRYVELLRMDTRAMLTYHFEPLRGHAALRSLLVVGEGEDDPVIRDRQDRWLPYLGAAEIARVPGGHLFFHDAPDAFSRLLQSFLKGDQRR